MLADEQTTGEEVWKEVDSSLQSLCACRVDYTESWYFSCRCFIVACKLAIIFKNQKIPLLKNIEELTISWPFVVLRSIIYRNEYIIEENDESIFLQPAYLAQHFAIHKYKSEVVITPIY